MPFLCLIASRPEPAVHPLVPSVVEDAEHGVRDPRLARRSGEVLEFLRGLPAQLQPLQIRGVGVGEFLAAGLDGEVTLGLGDLRLPGIAILGDQVAGKAGQVVVVDNLDGSLTPSDRFAGAGKVMVAVVARLLA